MKAQIIGKTTIDFTTGETEYVAWNEFVLGGKNEAEFFELIAEYIGTSVQNFIEHFDKKTGFYQYTDEWGTEKYQIKLIGA